MLIAKYQHPFDNKVDTRFFQIFFVVKNKNQDIFDLGLFEAP
jgi:hypothetical protein